MMKRWNAFGVVFEMIVLGISGLIAGMAGKIAGRVVDGENGEPLPEANVVVIASWDGGKESLLSVFPGPLEITARDRWRTSEALRDNRKVYF